MPHVYHEAATYTGPTPTQSFVPSKSLMLLSPLASPSKFHASLSLSLPPLAHDIHNPHDSFGPDDAIDSDDDYGEDSDESDDYAERSASEPPTDSDVSVEPLSLPIELILNIVELAASHRRTALALCRVASWVRAAVLPTLYGTLVLHGSGPSPFDLIAKPFSGVRTFSSTPLESALQHIRSLWLDVPPERAPRSLDDCPRLVQLALPLEAHATICQSQRWHLQETNALDLSSGESAARVRSFTVLGQSHPHRWAPLTSSSEGRAFLRGVTHLRLLNLCLSHYSMYNPPIPYLSLFHQSSKLYAHQSRSNTHQTSHTSASPTSTSASHPPPSLPPPPSGPPRPPPSQA